MVYRITSGMMYGTLFGNMQANLSAMLKLQEQITAQRKFTQASDDPIAVARGLGISTSIYENEQYIKNQEDAVSQLKSASTALTQMIEDAQRIRELVIQAGDGALTAEALKANSEEIRQLKESIRNIANTSVAGKYIFSGLDTGTTPFTYDASGRVVYGGSSQKISYEIENGVTSQVSFSGSELFPSNEKTYNVKSHYVPMDWTWTGREEKVQIRLGEDTIVKIQIPEQWIDEVANGTTDYSDYNRFRDPDEVRGLTMDQVAQLFNRSLEEGGASKIIGVKVEKDTDEGVQRLVFTSNTGEPLQITGWPDTDMAPLEQSIAGLVIDDSEPIEWTSNVLMGNKTITFPTGPVSFELSVGGAPAAQITLGGTYDDMDDLIGALDAAVSGAGLSAKASNGKVMLQSDAGLEIRVGGAEAVRLFGDIKASVPPDAKGLMGSINVSGWQPDRITPSKSITITTDTAQGSEEHTFELNNSASIYELVAAINREFTPMSGEPDVASIVNGRVTLRVAGDVTVKGDGVSEIFGTEPAATPADTTIAGTSSSITVQVGGSASVQVFISEGDTLEDIAQKVEAVTGMAARVSPDGKQLVLVAKRDRPYAEDMLNTSDAEEALAYPKFTLSASGAAVQLFDFLVTSDSETGVLNGIAVSKEQRRPTDHSHIDILDYLGMETAMKSTEFQAGEKLTVGPGGLHWRVMSGNNMVDLKLAEGDYSMEQIAERLRNAGLGWLEVTVDTFESPARLNQDAEESGILTSDNHEGATSRLVIKAVQNMPVTFLDLNGAGYANRMGLSNAIRTDADSGPVIFPGAKCLDPHTPAYVKVVVGDGKTYNVKLSQNAVTGADGSVDRHKVMAEIARQVNEQDGTTLLRVIKDTDGGESSLYSTTGEPVSIIDLPVPDSSWSSYTMGIAMQMGIHTGITASPAIQDDELVGAGTIRIRSLGRMIDIDVEATDTVKDVVEKIRDQAGDWLEVNYLDKEMSLAPNGSDVMFAICARDGAPVSMYDVTGTVAHNTLRSDNAINGTVQLADDSTTPPTNWPTLTTGAANAPFEENDTLTINVAGYSHTIDLYAAQQSTRDSTGAVVFTPNDLAELINARFQDEDLRAEIDNDGQMVIYSPRGYNVEIENSGRAADIFGTGLTMEQRGGGGEFNSIYNQQNISIRTGANTAQANFFDVLDNVSTTMEAENRQALSGYLLPQIDRFIDNLLKCHATEGALENRYANNVVRFKQNNAGLTELLDTVVGINLAKAASDMAMLRQVYEASLSIVSNIVQPTLVDFLR